MRVLLLLSICAACSGGREEQRPTTPTDATRTGRVVARVTGFRNGTGRAIARLYRGGEGFPSEAKAAYREATFEIRDGAATLTFDDVPHGEYAIWVCHDENGDGELETNILGMPKEGVGVSGPVPTFIPTYGSARFQLDGAASEHEIALKYL